MIPARTRAEAVSRDTPKSRFRTIAHGLPAQPRSYRQLRQPAHDLYRPHAYGRHALDEVEDVAGIVYFLSPVVWIVDDTAFLMRTDLIPVYQPVQRGTFALSLYS